VKLRFDTDFLRSYTKLRPKEQVAVKITLDIYKTDPRDPRLHWHQLRKSGDCSIRVKWDLRIILSEDLNSQIADVLDVGSHSKVY
jgi:mRNA-degrading endonuclease RelE of RelBE toxin-antitoxin system